MPRKTTNSKATTRKPAAKKPAAKKPAARKAPAKKPAAKAPAKRTVRRKPAATKPPVKGKKILVRHGLSRSKEVTAPEGSTVEMVLNDPDLRAVLGYGENIEAKSGGNVLSKSSSLENITTIDIVTKANTKN